MVTATSEIDLNATSPTAGCADAGNAADPTGPADDPTAATRGDAPPDTALSGCRAAGCSSGMASGAGGYLPGAGSDAPCAESGPASSTSSAAAAAESQASGLSAADDQDRVNCLLKHALIAGKASNADARVVRI